HARLRSLGPAAERQLRAAARETASAEARQRIAALLKGLVGAGADVAPDPEVVRFLRAIRVLEEIGTREAQAVLEQLANAAPEAPTGREAQAALERIRRVK
ncbi:MAG: hypothetical protein ACHQ1G_06990, partial [Planctomycetota bacterium]